MERCEEERQLTGTEIAVIGAACRFPGARNLDEYWRILRDGIETISFLSDDELDSSGIEAAFQKHSNYVKAAPLLDNIELFDASFFGLTPKEAEIMDPQHRLFLELAWEALELAGYDPNRYRGAIGVYAGARTNTYLYNLFSNPEAVKSLGAFEIGLGNDLAFLSTRVAYQLGLRGPAYSIHTACSTGLVAVHLACQSLLIDECQMALAGGVAVNIPQRAGYLYQEGGILSADGHCRTFDAEASGTLFGSGAGIVVLKRLEDALSDGDNIYALVKGSATNNDGALKASFTAPGVDGQAKVVSESMAVAGVDPETISYIEAHGTGTQLGDPIEIRALTKAFRTKTDKKNFCAIGSVKTNFGHLDAAAGIASFIKTVLALHNCMLPPTLHFEQPNPGIDFVNSPFCVNTALSEWRANSAPRRAGVSSFGIGGTNAHVILEEAPVREPSGNSRPWQLLTLSGKTLSALDTATANLIDHLKRHPSIDLADVAYTLGVGRKSFNCRRMVACRDHEDALVALEMDPQRVFTKCQEACERPVVFMFPGGGAQYLNMGYDLYHSEPTFREQVDICCQILQPKLGYDLRECLYAGQERATTPADQMKRASVGLPALFVIEYAMARLWMSWGIHPQAMIGHSLGEYVAACLAGVFSLEDALSLVVIRGRLFEQLPQGAMLSIPLSEDQVRPLMNGKLSLAAVNGPSQCVISGPVEAVEEMADFLRAKELEFRRIQINVAAHSEMVVSILEPFGEFVKKLQLKEPSIPYVSNVTGSWIEPGEATDSSYWTRHLRQTVRFGNGIGQLLQDSDYLLLEVGPGQTLSALAKLQTDARRAQMVLPSMRHPQELQSDVAFLLTTLGKLWLHGVNVEWPAFYAHERRHRAPLPTYPFERQRYWVEPKTEIAAKQVQLNRGKNSKLADWFYVPSWTRCAVPPISDFSETPRSWLVFTDECGIGSVLIESLKETGHDIAIVKSSEKFERIDKDRYFINPRGSEDYEAVLNSLQEQGREPNRIVHLWNVMPDEARSAGLFFQEAQDQGYYSLLFLTRALVKKRRSDPIHIEIVSNYLQDVNGEGCLPEKATLLAPCIVVSQEYPNIICRSIDIVAPRPDSQQAANLADQLMAEFKQPSFDPIVAYRGAYRWVRRYEPFPLTESTSMVRSFRQNGVYLITGGLGGVGLILAEYLAQTVQARLILTKQSAFPSKDQWSEWLQTHGDEDDISRKIKRIQAIEELGAEVLVASLDAADEEQMETLVTHIYEKFGQLNGVLHAAGVTHGSSVYRSAVEVGSVESEAQFKPKVYGVYVLEKVLQGKAVDFCLLFSSNAAVLGGLGFLAYSAANLFMDSFASSRNRNGSLTWLSASWDHWPEETRQYAGIRTSIDQYTMTRSESEEAFRRVVCMAPGGQVVISTGDLPTRLDLWVTRKIMLRGQDSGSDAQTPTHQRPPLLTSYVAPRNETEQMVADVWQQVLGIQGVGIHDNFFDLGGHSLLVTQVIGRLRDTFQIDLPLSKLFDYPTVAGLAEVVGNIQAEVGDQERIEILNILSRLSEEEVEVEIAKRTDMQGH